MFFQHRFYVKTLRQAICVHCNTSVGKQVYECRCTDLLVTGVYRLLVCRAVVHKMCRYDIGFGCAVVPKKMSLERQTEVQSLAKIVPAPQGQVVLPVEEEKKKPTGKVRAHRRAQSSGPSFIGASADFFHSLPSIDPVDPNSTLAAPVETTEKTVAKHSGDGHVRSLRRKGSLPHEKKISDSSSSNSSSTKKPKYLASSANPSHSNSSNSSTSLSISHTHKRIQSAGEKFDLKNEPSTSSVESTPLDKKAARKTKAKSQPQLLVQDIALHFRSMEQLKELEAEAKFPNSPAPGIPVSVTVPASAPVFGKFPSSSSFSTTLFPNSSVLSAPSVTVVPSSPRKPSILSSKNSSPTQSPRGNSNPSSKNSSPTSSSGSTSSPNSKSEYPTESKKEASDNFKQQLQNQIQNHMAQLQKIQSQENSSQNDSNNFPKTEVSENPPKSGVSQYEPFGEQLIVKRQVLMSPERVRKITLCSSSPTFF